MKLTKENAIWVLKHLQELKEGQRCVPESESYLERPLSTRSGGHHAPFENVTLAIGEVERRLKTCGIDGFLCKATYVMEESEETLAWACKLPVKAIPKRIKDALSYISNKWPKGRSYQEFRDRKKRQSGV